MKQIVFVLLLIFSLPVHAGFRMFGKNGQYFESSDPAPTSREVNSFAFQGQGDSARNMTIPAGSYKVTVDHADEGLCHMEARLLSGQDIVLLTDFTGKGTDERQIQFATGGEYTLSVSADGNWTVRMSSEDAVSEVQSAQSAEPFRTVPTADTWPRVSSGVQIGNKDTDMTGIEWRQSRGVVNGRNSEAQTAKYGYESGRYLVTATSTSNTRFTVWVFSRRGMKRRLFDGYRVHDYAGYLELKDKDEIWFSVATEGNWEIIVERAR